PARARSNQSSDDGVEFVRACDSGSDDVTNQCINRIPEDIGSNTNNHACAYHEAEVKCLGLCGNTLTWKVAYNNALKRYRLVCARYIDDRIAEKEESGEGGEPDTNAVRKHKKKKAADEEDSGDSPSGDDAEDAAPAKKKGKKTPIAFDMSALTSDSVVASSSSEALESSSASAKSQAKDAKPTKSGPSKGKPSPKSTSKPAAKATGSAAKSASGKGQSDKSDDAKHSGSEKEGKSSAKGQGILPTMDPDMAAAGSLQMWSGLTTLVGLLALLSNI
ncbi:hypothetical protein FBU59_002039, partial [Linderina macrospora]